MQAIYYDSNIYFSCSFSIILLETATRIDPYSVRKKHNKTIIILTTIITGRVVY